MKQGQDCSLLLKHSKGKVTATLQSVKPILPSSSTFSSTSAKRKKKNGDKKKKLDKLLAYHQRLVVEKGLPPSRLMEEHAAASSSVRKKFKCDQCDFETESQRGLKVHIGRSHKNPEVLREELEVSLVVSDPGDVARADDLSINLGEVNEDPPESAPTEVREDLSDDLDKKHEEQGKSKVSLNPEQRAMFGQMFKMYQKVNLTCLYAISTNR